jgi:hypothetical protein
LSILLVSAKPKLVSKTGPAPPEIVKPLEDMDVVIGDRAVKLKCEVKGDDVTAAWYHNGIEIRQGRQHKCKKMGVVVALILTEISEDDGGTYECRLSNPGGKAKTSCTLTTQGQSVTVKVDRVSRSCESV